MGTAILAFSSFNVGFGQCNTSSPPVINITSQADWNAAFGSQTLNHGHYKISGNLTIDLEGNMSPISVTLTNYAQFSNVLSYQFTDASSIEILSNSDVKFVNYSPYDVLFYNGCSNPNSFWGGFLTNYNTKVSFVGNHITSSNNKSINILRANVAFTHIPGGNANFTPFQSLTIRNVAVIDCNTGVDVFDYYDFNTYISKCEFNWTMHYKDYNTFYATAPNIVTFGQHVKARCNTLTILGSKFENNAIEVMNSGNEMNWLHKLDIRGQGVSATLCNKIRISARRVLDRFNEGESELTSSSECIFEGYIPGESNEFKNLSMGVELNQCVETNVLKNDFDNCLKSILVKNIQSDHVVIQENQIEFDYTGKSGDFVIAGYGIRIEKVDKFLAEKNHINCTLPSTVAHVYYHGMELMQNGKNHSPSDNGMLRLNNIVFNGEVPVRQAGMPNIHQMNPADFINNRYISGFEFIGENENTNIECNEIDFSGIRRNNVQFSNGPNSYTGIFPGTIINESNFVPIPANVNVLNNTYGTSNISSGNNYFGLDTDFPGTIQPNGEPTWAVNDAANSNQTIIHWGDNNLTQAFHGPIPSGTNFIFIDGLGRISTNSNSCVFNPCTTSSGGGNANARHGNQSYNKYIGTVSIEGNSEYGLRAQILNYVSIAHDLDKNNVLRVVIFDLITGKNVISEINSNSQKLIGNWEKLSSGKFRIIVTDNNGVSYKGLLLVE